MISASLDEILDALLIDGEKRASSAVLGTHIRDSGSVGDGQMSNAGTEEFDKFPHHAFRAKVLRGEDWLWVRDDGCRREGGGSGRSGRRLSEKI